MVTVVDIFSSKKDEKPLRQPKEIIQDFHDKLEEVLNDFQTLSVKDKYEVVESLVSINKDLFKLYMDLKSRHEFHLNN